MRMSAIISTCGLYRYRLDRDFETAGRSAAFIMVNPSTADGTEDDATIRKLIGFSKRNDIARFSVGNLFAYRATDIKELAKPRDPVGPENDAWLSRIMVDADIHIVAWGPVSKLPKGIMRRRWQAVLKMMQRAGLQPYCLGDVAMDGHPKHPLMLSYESPLTPWDGAYAASM